MFSLGVTMYQLISGRYAFGCDNLTSHRITDKEPSFPISLWNNVSYEARDVIKQLLDKKHWTRITAENALKHDFFKNNGVDNLEKQK